MKVPTFIYTSFVHKDIIISDYLSKILWLFFIKNEYSMI